MLPHSPFSTQLSGSAKEAETRIRNIFQRPQKSPPIPVLIFAGALALTCGGLVSCQGQVGTPSQEADYAWVAPALGESAQGKALGFPVTASYTEDEYGTRWYDYQLTLPDGRSALLDYAETPLIPLDLDGDGTPELVAGDGNYLQVYCRWEDGSLRKLDLRRTALEHMGLAPEHYGMYYDLILELQPEVGTVSIRPAGEDQELAELSLFQLFSETRQGEILLSAPGEDGELTWFESWNPSDGTCAWFYDGLNLDGVGTADDQLTAVSYGIDVGCRTALQIALGTGEAVTWGYDDYSFLTFLPAYLSRPDRQSLVLELDVPYSNYGAASYVVLELEDGALRERARLDGGGAALQGAYLQEGADGLQEARIPTLYDKWHQPIWGTWAWDGAGFSFQSDGFFTDTYPLQVSGGRTLTLSLRCTPTGNYSWECYDQIQILEGNAPVQTIPAGFTPPGEAQEVSFLANSPSMNWADVRDINFDGYDDFGLQWDATHDAVHRWFVWDPERASYQYLADLAGDLELDPEAKRLTETWVDIGTVNTYTYDGGGQLQLVDSRGPQ